jgi:hypothetical protein
MVCLVVQVVVLAVVVQVVQVQQDKVLQEVITGLVAVVLPPLV